MSSNNNIQPNRLILPYLFHLLAQSGVSVSWVMLLPTRVNGVSRMSEWKKNECVKVLSIPHGVYSFQGASNPNSSNTNQVDLVSAKVTT
jgi:hypothetical protein